MVMVIFGNQRWGKSPLIRLNQLALSAPSMWTGTTHAPVLAAMNAGPFVDFHHPP